MALALASTGSALVNAGLLYFYLHQRNIYRFGAHWKKLFMQFMFANLVMIAVLGYALSWYNGDVSQWVRVFEVVVLCMVGVVAYLAALMGAGFRLRHLKP
jgi:putative peptidoglycan lipid II flippase